MKTSVILSVVMGFIAGASAQQATEQFTAQQIQAQQNGRPTNEQQAKCQQEAASAAQTAYQQNAQQGADQKEFLARQLELARQMATGVLTVGGSVRTIQDLMVGTVFVPSGSRVELVSIEGDFANIRFNGQMLKMPTSATTILPRWFPTPAPQQPQNPLK
jgi:hypothetical protein